MLERIAALAVCAVLGRAQSVIELARKAPPELFADAVINMVQRGEFPPAALPAVLIEAFEAAKRAKEPVRLVAMPPAADSRPALREAALQQGSARAGLSGSGMDALSLEARVVALMARTDPDKAREMFQSIDRPALTPRPCADPMIADDSAYYELAAKLTGLNTMAVIGPGNSPGELASLAKLIRLASEAKLVHEDQGLTPDEFRLLTGALALKMQTAAPDYRAFTMTAEDLSMELDGLMARARDLGVPADELAMAARKLAVTQLSSPRCHEEFGEAMGFVDWFNRGFGKRLDPIGVEETIAKGDLGPVKTESYFRSGSSKELADRFQKLRTSFGNTTGNTTGNTPGTPEWRDQLAEFLRQYAEWKPSGDDIDIFHQRITVLHGLWQLIPAGEDRDKLMSRVIEFLKGNEVEREYPAEWLFQVRALMDVAMNSAPAERAKLLAAFRESGDPGLVLLAALNQ